MAGKSVALMDMKAPVLSAAAFQVGARLLFIRPG